MKQLSQFVVIPTSQLAACLAAWKIVHFLKSSEKKKGDDEIFLYFRIFNQPHCLKPSICPSLPPTQNSNIGHLDITYSELNNRDHLILHILL